MPWNDLYKKYETVAKIWAPISLLVAILKTILVDVPKVGATFNREIAVRVTALTFQLLGMVFWSFLAAALIYDTFHETDLSKPRWSRKQYIGLWGSFFFAILSLMAYAYPIWAGICAMTGFSFLTTLVVGLLIQGFGALLRKSGSN